MSGQPSRRRKETDTGKRKAKAETPELDNIPRVTVTLTDEACWITRHDRSGAATLTYPAAIGEVCNAFNQFGANTGLLPAETLFWQSRSGVMRIGVWLPAAVRTIRVQVKTQPETLRVPLPGLMVIGQGPQYTVLALTERPTTGREMLYKTPLPNVHDNGAVCAGSVTFPVASAATMSQAVALFFDSLFNADLSYGKLRSGELLPFLRKLSKSRARKFPIDQLVPTGVTVNELISGKRGQGVSADDGVWTADDDDGTTDAYGNVRFAADVWGNEEDDDED
jgi:PRTRC genetic system protein B